MTIGIEAERANNPQKTGVEHYAKQLILHLAMTDNDNSYILYLRTQPQDWLKQLPGNFKIRVIPFPLFWTQLRLSWEMFFHPVDVLFIPASALPIIHPKKSVATIHDVAWRYFPQSFTWFNRHFLELSTRFALKRASNIIAVSESTKQDLVKFYEIDPAKVTVVHHGYDAQGDLPLSANGQILDLKDGQPFVLFLSTLQPRKNLEGLIEAFAQLKKEQPELPQKLVIAGALGWKYGSILKKMEQHKNILIYLNHVSDAGRFSLLKRASALVLPSFYEGFGMPILESFAAGVPVATSNISSLPEVAGEAAVYFDPHDQNQIKSAIKNLLLDKSLAESLKAKGRERLKLFSWNKCANQTLAVLDS